jgi:hypothetical protein
VYKLEIRADDFESNTICMGWQLVEILKNFKDLKYRKWVVFDVYGTTHDDLLKLFKVDKTRKIDFDSTERLISSVEKVIQFEQGVFCLVSDSKKLEFKDGFPETEAPEGMQIKDSLVEIRTFDYTLFEIYSNNKKYLGKIKNYFSNQDLNFKEI